MPKLFAQDRKLDFGANTIPNKVVYKLKPQQLRLASPNQGTSMSQALQQVGAKQVHQKFPATATMQNARKAAPAVDLSLIYEVDYTSSLTFEQVKAALLHTGQVAYVEPLYIREPFHQPNDPAADSTKTTQFYLKQVQAYGGWAVEKGDTNVVIGILDTGFRLTHQDLKTKVKRNYADPIDGIDNDGDGLVDNFTGWDFADGDNDVSFLDDVNGSKGHGTSVAGVAAAATNNAAGIAGLGYHAKFMPIKVFTSKKSGGKFGGYEAIVYAANKGCKVINLSWGGTGSSQFEQDVINYAVLEKDVLIIAAAGNTNDFIKIYPAAYNNVVSVGGAANTDVKFADHTYNYQIDLIAPSANIYTASSATDTRYGNAGGTSFASPMVAGAAALVRKHYPTLNARQIAARLRATTDHIYQLEGNQPYLEMLGSGRLNVKKALIAQDLKAVRCTSFTPITPLQHRVAGSTVSIDASFTNLLSPTSSLQATLTSSSPYVSITRGTASLGSLGTMENASTGNQPFQLKISEDAPINLTVYLRLGYTDGDYSDFQYFELEINPDYKALTANNLHVTLNSKGNFGYNGFNFSQGEGVVYKGSSPLLFEGGLMIATSPEQVSDNIHNAENKSDEDFVTTSFAQSYHNTPLAKQEVRTVMHDNHHTPNEANVGVQVKQIGYAWDEAPSQDFVILEYHIKNITDAPFEKLYTGLFADWDIGLYYQNAADWDEATQMGYVYNTNEPLPYAGIKLLTRETPTHFAFTNEGTVAGDINIEDGFTTEEKFKTLTRAAESSEKGKHASGNVSHVVGAHTIDVAPGATNIVAFAVLAADNLDELKKHAAAAQQKYNSFRTSPAPIAFADTICAGSNVVWTPEGGKNFNFYVEQDQKQVLVATSSSYEIENLNKPKIIYAASVDSLFESKLVPGIFSLPKTPEPIFEVSADEIAAGTPVTFTNKSRYSKEAHWVIDNAWPVTGETFTTTFEQPGTYQVQLTVADRFNCSEATIRKEILVTERIPTAIPEAIQNLVQLYPNPTTGLLHIKLTDGTTNQLYNLSSIGITNLMGRTSYLHTNQLAGELTVDLSELAAGVYFTTIRYGNYNIVKRIVVIKP
ncbi:S8 family serine peptidase [Pontibacter rugosus]|uniref:S8 family serine peptidase n=1 Tax=Pontibacter rugosus TaxID=1745966 RepID=A0ABW3SU01_9BACT